MFNLNLFLTKTISFATLHTSLICMVLIPFIKSCNFGAVELSLILSIKKFTRIFTDVPFGIIFDKFGAKTVFFLGRALKLISFFILLLEPSFITFSIAMLFDGMSYSAIYGKVNAYIYNVLSANNIISKYQKAASIYYFIMDVVLSGASFIAAVLLKSHGYKILIYISIIMNLFSLIILIFITEENVTNRDSNSYKSASIIEMCKTLVYLFKTQRIIIWLLLFYGFGNFIAWQFGVIATMVLMDMNYSASQVTFVASAAKIVMAIGCLFPMFGFKKGISNIFIF